jgi:hypothetical protein
VNRYHSAFSLFACLLLFSGWPAQAAETAKLSGAIFTLGADQVQTVWPNARVTLKNQRTGVAVSTVSGELGEYSFLGVEPGEYELSVALAGFEAEKREVKLEPRADLRLDIQLRPKRQVQEVVVRAEVPQVEPTSTSTAGPTLPQRVLKSAPLVNERFQDALPLLPGVVRGPDGLINVKGARATQSGTLVNSVSVIDPVTGQAAISLPIEAVEAVRVLSNPFSAEYGRFVGGVTEVETRGGTDTWKVLLTNLFPRFRRRDGNIVGLESITPRFTFAGPLRKGKAYLFQSFDYRFVRTRVPSLPELHNDTVFETFDSYTQFDWNITANQRFTASLSLYPQNLGFVNLNTFNPEDVTPNFRQRGFFLAFNLRSIFSGGGFLESSLSVKRFDAHVFPARALASSLFLFPEQNFGTWYNRQDRESTLWQGSQTYHFRPRQARGSHSLQLGYLFLRSSYDGTVGNLPVVVLRADGTVSQRLAYVRAGALEQSKNELGLFFQDKWQLHPRFNLDFGVRLDRDGISKDILNVAPRLAFVLAPTRDNKTALRAGLGIFYDKIPLSVSTFRDYPAESVLRFAAVGLTVVDGPRTFLHRIFTPDGKLHVPYSVAWSAQFDRELARNLLLRFGYEQRELHRDFFLDPFEISSSPLAELRLSNAGRQGYREFQWVLRWQANERTTLFYSFVRSRAVGDLNGFDQFFGNFPNPIVRPNQRERLPYDSPDRFLFWGTIGLPWKLEFSPVLELRDGFPFSRVDNDLNFVGPRNRAGRFPAFAAFDFQIVRSFAFSFLARKYRAKLGLKAFNITGHFNPRDVQQNIFSTNFGRFFNSVGRQFRGKFEIEF